MDDRSGASKTTGRAGVRAEREHRLAKALRANLRRRKEQSRARAEEPAGSPQASDKPDPAKRSG